MVLEFYSEIKVAEALNMLLWYTLLAESKIEEVELDPYDNDQTNLRCAQQPE